MPSKLDLENIDFKWFSIYSLCSSQAIKSAVNQKYIIEFICKSQKGFKKKKHLFFLATAMIYNRSCRGKKGARCNWHQVPIWENFKGCFFMDGGQDLSPPLSFILFFFPFCKVCFALELSFNISSPKYQSFRECTIRLCTQRKSNKTSAQAGL